MWNTARCNFEWLHDESLNVPKEGIASHNNRVLPSVSYSHTLKIRARAHSQLAFRYVGLNGLNPARRMPHCEPLLDTTKYLCRRLMQ